MLEWSLFLQEVKTLKVDYPDVAHEEASSTALESWPEILGLAVLAPACKRREAAFEGEANARGSMLAPLLECDKGVSAA